MNSRADGGDSRRSTTIQPPLDRETRVQRIGDAVKTGTYRPPLDGVVESLVMALLPHFRARG